MDQLDFLNSKTAPQAWVTPICYTHSNSDGINPKDSHAGMFFSHQLEAGLGSMNRQIVDYRDEREAILCFFLHPQSLQIALEIQAEGKLTEAHMEHKELRGDLADIVRWPNTTRRPSPMDYNTSARTDNLPRTIYHFWKQKRLMW